MPDIFWNTHKSILESLGLILLSDSDRGNVGYFSDKDEFDPVWVFAVSSTIC
jgi:hypothetical protein